ncbi:MAG: hypothetical protein IJT24_02220, partial [Lachnospiraceae bacterium]|nr:hypothetical protein [Lachnospiraceae bacterium]
MPTDQIKTNLTDQFIVKDKNILSFTISLRRMRPDFVRNNAAKAAKIRRRKRQSKKNFVVY